MEQRTREILSGSMCFRGSERTGGREKSRTAALWSLGAKGVMITRAGGHGGQGMGGSGHPEVPSLGLLQSPDECSAKGTALGG